MIKKPILFFFAMLVISFLVEASEFWLITKKFVVKPGENLVVNVREGDDFFGSPWKLAKDSISKMELHHKNTVSNVQPRLVESTKNNLQIPLAQEGTHILLLETKETYLDKNSEDFNAFLKSYEIDDVYTQREKSNSLNTNGREITCRYAKLIVQAGEKTDNTFRKEVGIPLDIVPVQNPYDLKIGDPVQFKVLYQGKPLFGAKIRVWNFYNNRTAVQNIYSQQDGMISTHISNAGAWMVSVVKTVPVNHAEADWKTHWTSLVFGVK